MADKKISALTASTTPLAGTEVLPIVQSGTTVKVAVSDLTAGRAVSATQLTLSTGSTIIGTAGQGIDFSANTNPPGMTSELLNYYAEGTGTATRSGFTEVVGGGSITSTYYYTRVGRTVFMNITLVCAGGAAISWGGSGTAAFTGLPFTAATYAVGQWLNTTNLSTTGPTAWISTAMYVAGAAATITTDNSFSFSGTFNV